MTIKLNSAFQASHWETVPLAKAPKGVGMGFQRDLSRMNANDAKDIGDEPWEFCIEDVKEALRIMLEHEPSPGVTGETLTHYARRLNKLRREIKERVE